MQSGPSSSESSSSQPSEQQAKAIDTEFLVQTHPAISLLDQARSLQASAAKQNEDDTILQDALSLQRSQASMMTNFVNTNAMNN